MLKKTPKKISVDRALEKAMRYCMYQERCVLDIEQRFEAWGLPKQKWDELVDKLLADDFINEARYIESFVRGKFFGKKWGRHKIILGLKKKKISGSAIERIMNEEISEEDYNQMIRKLIEFKSEQIEKVEGLQKRDKIYRFLIGKGFESDLIVQHLGHY